MKVLITDKVHPICIELLKKEAEVEEFIDWKDQKEIETKLADCDALIVRSRTKVRADIIEKAKKLKVIGRAGVGTDNIDKEAAKARGIPVVNTPGASALSVAELTLGHALALLRKIPQADKSVKKGKWEKKLFRGTEVSKKTWGVIGLGNIGIQVMQLLHGFDCRKVAYDPFANTEKAHDLGVELMNLEELLKNADIISIHVPLVPATKHMINKKALDSMKENAIIINISRGGIIDESALHDALKEGKIAGAALDVFEVEPPKDSPLMNLDNIIFTPHLGAQTNEGQDRIGVELAEKVLGVLT
jgi:D-3-phosphoglycerate dehydrogenase / 2-oxoglutarate reductase